MRKRLCCLLLTAALAFGLITLSAAAEEIIFFTAVNNTLLELSKETMPVKYSSMIYVPSTVFNSNALGTYSYYSRSTQTVLISDGERNLYFDMSAGDSYDGDDAQFRYAAIYTNDTAYVPAYFVSQYFGLGYSYIRQDGKHIIRLTIGNVMGDDEFFRAASSLMESRLKDYQKSQEAAVTATPVPPTPTSPPAVVPTSRPVTPTPSPTPTPNIPAERDRSGVVVNLAVLGLGENSRKQLDELEKRELPVCFFASAEEVYANADLVRRIIGEGGSLGVRFEEDPAAEAEAFRIALRDTAMCTSFLAYAGNLDWETMLAAEETGLALWHSNATIATYDGCSRWLSSAEWTCSLMIKPEFTEFRALKELLEKDHYTVEAITETTKAR